jgi:hypothetical protein
LFIVIIIIVFIIIIFLIIIAVIVFFFIVICRFHVFSVFAVLTAGTIGFFAVFFFLHFHFLIFVDWVWFWRVFFHVDSWLVDRIFRGWRGSIGSSCGASSAGTGPNGYSRHLGNSSGISLRAHGLEVQRSWEGFFNHSFVINFVPRLSTLRGVVDAMLEKLVGYHDILKIELSLGGSGEFSGIVTFEPVDTGNGDQRSLVPVSVCPDPEEDIANALADDPWSTPERREFPSDFLVNLGREQPD